MNPEEATTLEWTRAQDEGCRHWLGVSRSDFIARYKAGGYDGDDSPALWNALALFPELDHPTDNDVSFDAWRRGVTERNEQ